MLEAIKLEIALQKDYLGTESIETIYFGGGTPSLLEGEDINAIIDQISHFYPVANNAEVTIEANPDDLSEQKVKALRQTPVNRFSIGIQSFFDDDLLWMNRAHRAHHAEASVKRVQDAGFENITADLIYGFPLLTDAKWKLNMEKFFELSIPHLSAYSLTVEPKTALASFIQKKVYPPLNESQCAAQFSLLIETTAQMGYEQYEISNFAKPGCYSRHNSAYWSGHKYLGIGPSAHSFNTESRQWNVANNAKYMQNIAEGKIPAETEILTERDRLNEYIMTSLRTIWGLNLHKLAQISAGADTELLITAEPFFENGWLTRTDQTLTLTPTGKLFADKIASDLFF